MYRLKDSLRQTLAVTRAIFDQSEPDWSEIIARYQQRACRAMPVQAHGALEPTNCPQAAAGRSQGGTYICNHAIAHAKIVSRV